MIDIQNLMDCIIREGITPEDLLARTIRDLYILENYFIDRNNGLLRDKVRSVIAYVKLSYDFGQRMDLARKYLLHRIKLLEVRVNDMNLEMSVIRGLSPPLEKNLSLQSSGASQQSGNWGLVKQDKQNDQEIEIILDTRIINEIDMSTVALHDISRRLKDKRSTLIRIEQEMEDVSSTLRNSVELGTSLSFEHHPPDSSDWVERTLDPVTPKRSREGGARITPPKYMSKMDSTMEKGKNVLSQEDFGASRDRQSGGPDTARSSSDEGTTGVVSVSVPVEQAATAELTPSEMLSCINIEAINTIQSEATSTPRTDKKRKVTMDSDSEGDIGNETRRPNKARVIESVELPTVISSGSDDHRKIDNKVYSTDDLEEYAESTNGQNPTTLELKELRQKKAGRAEGTTDSQHRGSSSFREDFINSVVSRELASREDTRRAELSKSRDSGSEYCEPIELSSDRTEISSSYSSKKKKNKKVIKDRTQKYCGQKSKRRAAVQIIVTKEEAEKELQMTRQDWLDMDSAALGARCLDHLAELEQQRARCSNISGRVAGRMKDGKIIATEIVKAMIEKLTCVDNAFTLKNENFALKEELGEIKRKEQAQSVEIQSLRKMVVGLQREIRALKEGLGPFPAVVTDAPISHADLRTTIRQSSSEKRDISSPSVLPLPIQEAVGLEMEVEPMAGNIPGCSTDAEYMNRDFNWPVEEGSTPWMDEHVEVEASKHNIYKENIVNTNKTSGKPKSSEIKSNADRAKVTMYSDNLNANNKFNLVTRDKKFKKVSSEIDSKMRNKGIKIIEDRQLIPPRNIVSGNCQEWIEVTDKRRQRVQGVQARDDRSESASQRRQPVAIKDKPRPGRRLIKPAVVSITSKPEGLTYAQILAKAREKVSLKDLGIQTTVIRRALNGAVIIEVPGPQGKKLAESLRVNLMEVLGEDARVTSPVATGELRLRGIEPSTTQEEILMELESISSSPRHDFKVSAITNMRDGMGVVWVTCPLQAAIKIAERGTVTLGWTRVKVDLLRKRPVQCFKCWHFGHVRPSCRSDLDRVGSCFRCGIAGHTIGSCKANAASCLICKDIGCESRHRMGSIICLRNHGHPSGIQPIRKVSVSARKASQASVFDDRYN